MCGQVASLPLCRGRTALGGVVGGGGDRQGAADRLDPEELPVRVDVADHRDEHDPRVNARFYVVSVVRDDLYFVGVVAPPAPTPAPSIFALRSAARAALPVRHVVRGDRRRERMH